MCGVVLVALLVASNFGVYLHTREKWHELGRINGKTHGLVTAMQVMCQFATTGGYHLNADAQLSAKGSIITFLRHGELVEIRCE